MRILIIIPAHNEEANILDAITDIQRYLPSCDYLVINDASSDHTASILDCHDIHHIDLPVNLGLTGAVQTGYQYAYLHNYDAAIQFDGDGQHQARFINSLAKEIENGCDIVIGSRFVNKKKELSLRMIGSRILSLLIQLTTGQIITDPTSGMRMLNRRMLHSYAFLMNAKPEPDTLVYQIHVNQAKIKEIQVDMNERDNGKSMYDSLWNSCSYMLRTAISMIFLSR